MKGRGKLWCVLGWLICSIGVAVADESTPEKGGGDHKLNQASRIIAAPVPGLALASGARITTTPITGLTLDKTTGIAASTLAGATLVQGTESAQGAAPAQETVLAQEVGVEEGQASGLLSEEDDEGITAPQIMAHTIARHQRPFEFVEQRVSRLDPRGRTLERKWRRFQRLDDPDLQKYLLILDEPAAVQGVALLIRLRKKGGEQWVYLPSLGGQMVRMMPGGGGEGRFMGIDFTPEDLLAENPDKYHYVRRGDRPCAGGRCYVVDAFLQEERLQQLSPYRFRRLLIAKESLFVTSIEYYDRKEGVLIKQQFNNDPVQLDGNLWRADTIVMENRQTGHKTTLETLKRDFAETATPGEMFSQRWIASRKHMP
ncbi:MAG: outer membrane lipoprotein-sorting protein [Magnetococcales bacterium]|nr:outer membrane lipoprotein-sorting protein [Magnetococcales bacterium]